MKKLICWLMIAMMLLSSAALADSSRVTGTIPKGMLAVSAIEGLFSDTGFEMTIGDIKLSGAVQADGSLLVGNAQQSFRVSVAGAALLAPLMQRLKSEPTFENAMYSSKYIQAQQIELSAAETLQLALSALDACPLLDAAGTLRPALEQAAAPNETWATVTRYEADVRQYPNDWMVQVNVFAPVLPYMRIEVESDDFGSSFEVAISETPVTDWDETVLAIEDAAPGQAAGKLVQGFTMVYDNGKEKDTYVEAVTIGFEQAYKLEMDCVVNDAEPRSWYAAGTLSNTLTGDVVLEAGLQSVSTSAAPAPQVSTDNVTNAAAVFQALLGL